MGSNGLLAEERTGVNPNWTCASCRHLRSIKDQTCEAFPEGIPFVVLTGQHKHQIAIPGDQGIQYEKMEESS